MSGEYSSANGAEPGLVCASLDISLVSHYQSPLTSPAKSPSNCPRDYDSSLASTSLDFSVNNHSENDIFSSDHFQTNNPTHFNQHENRASSLESTCTLVPEADLEDVFVTKASTNPFIDDYFCQTFSNTKLDYVKLLANFKEFESQMDKMNQLEKHIEEISLQLKLARKNITQINQGSYGLIQKLIQTNPTPKVLCDAQTQTDNFLQFNNTCESRCTSNSSVNANYDLTLYRTALSSCTDDHHLDPNVSVRQSTFISTLIIYLFCFFCR